MGQRRPLWTFRHFRYVERRQQPCQTPLQDRYNLLVAKSTVLYSLILFSGHERALDWIDPRGKRRVPYSDNSDLSFCQASGSQNSL